MKESGFYHDGIWNSVIYIEGKPFRHRVEILVVKGNSVFVARKPDGSYAIPGGSTEKDCSPIKQVVNECHEEAFIDPVNVQYMGTYLVRYGIDAKRPKWMKDIHYNVVYAGSKNDIYCGTFAGKYNGHVDTQDLSETIRNGDFVSIPTAMNFLSKEHKKALNQYLQKYYKPIVSYI